MVLLTVEIMIAPVNSIKPKKADALPKAKRVYVQGKLYPKLQVPFREIHLASTKDFNGQIEVNEPVRVYDCSGPWGDSKIPSDINKGLLPLRHEWIYHEKMPKNIKRVGFSCKIIVPLSEGRPNM